MPTNVIEVRDLTKKFRETTAVDGLTFDVAEGEVFGLLGPNGAGKTTTVRILCCLISKTSGDARVAGYQTENPADSLAIRKMIGLVPDDVGLYGELSAYENLDYYGKLYECPKGQREAQIERFLKMMDLWGQKDQPVSDFSKGMKQKVAIARALVHDPKLLFFDEPTANLDPESSKVDLFTHHTLGYLYYPNWNIAVILFLLAPLACTLGVGYNVLISSRVSDTRSAYQLGALIVLPFGAVYVLSEIQVLTLTTGHLLIMAAVLAVVDAIVFYLARATFNRDEILTKWK